VFGPHGIFSALAGLCAAAWVLLFARSRIGGVTGDVFGMVIEVVETISLLMFAMRL